MTLCAAWIRQGQSDEGQELVFATDSRLRMGEAWDMGLKLFNLGRSDCFFGMMWPSGRGEPWFLGRRINPYDAPPMRFIDPETTAFVEGLPQQFDDLEAYDFLEEAQFVQKCYPQKKLDPMLHEAQRNRLQRILRDAAYREFIAQRAAVVIAVEEAAQLQAAEIIDEQPTEQEL